MIYLLCIFDDRIMYKTVFQQFQNFIINFINKFYKISGIIHFQCHKQVKLLLFHKKTNKTKNKKHMLICSFIHKSRGMTLKQT